MALIASGLVLMLVARLAEARHVQALSVHDDLVIKQAQWVLQQLRDASEAYSDLALGSVLEAAACEGLYTNITLLTLRLTHPALASGQPASDHYIMVATELTPGQEGTKATWAIDEFPTVSSACIEGSFRESARAQRRTRDYELQRLILEANREVL